MESNYLIGRLMDHKYRSGAHAFTPPANQYAAILKAHRYRALINSQAVTLNQLVAVVANDGKVHLYKVTTAGTVASTQGALYPGTPNEAISDGTATLTEQDAALRANTAGTVLEPSGGGYARKAISSTPGASAGFSAAGNGVAGAATGASAVVVTGSTPRARVVNNAAITFDAPTGDWCAAPECWWATATFDALTVGNLLEIAPLPAASMPKSIANGDQAPVVPAGSMLLDQLG
jgi:hypothetical protein